MTSVTHAWSLAIDFGTSNSAAAHSGATSRSIEALSLTHTSNLMPSAVFVDTAGAVLVGGAALNSAAHNPAGFIASPKRLIGAQPAVSANGRTLPVYALVAAVMRTVIGRGVAAHAGAMPDRVVLTHPEAWAPAQIQVLTEAAMDAGIPAERITTISEPRAAAGHYSRSHALQHGTRLAVFDFGGGTLDIAVLEVTPTNAFRVIAARGDNGLGGKNFDALLQRWVEDRLADRDPDHTAWLRRTAPIDAIQSLQDSIQQAKELLSETPSATITVPGPRERTTLQITRDEFDELITPAVDAAVQLTRTTLADAGLTHPDQLTALYLTGGSSRIPLIQQRLGELGPVATLDDPKTVVAQGALLTVLADSAPTQPRGIPEAADLMPTWNTQLRTLGSPAKPASTRRRWLRIGAAAVAVIAAAAIVTTIVTTASGNDDGPTDTPQATETFDTDTTTVAPVGPTGEDGGPILTDADEIRQQLPGALQSQITECTNGSFTDNGALKLDCTLNENGTLSGLKIAGGLSPSLRIHINVDDNEAAREVRNLRNGVYSGGKGTVVEDTNRQAAAEIAPSLSDNEYDISYANTGTGLILSVSELSSVENARTFLTRSGLIS